jgi:hypothetical protein
MSLILSIAALVISAGNIIWLARMQRRANRACFPASQVFVEADKFSIVPVASDERLATDILRDLEARIPTVDLRGPSRKTPDEPPAESPSCAS